MTAPERIYRDETGLWSRNTAAFSTFSEVRVSPTGVEYIRADIHEAEIDALKAEISHLCAEAFQSDLDALKVANQQLMDEMAALKMPPKVLSAEEVTEAGFYLVRADNINPWVPCIVVRINEEIDELRMLLLGRSEEFSVVGELRPFEMPEVCDAG